MRIKEYFDCLIKLMQVWFGGEGETYKEHRMQALGCIMRQRVSETIILHCFFFTS